VQSLNIENKSLQDKIISITNQVIKIDQFKAKAMEIYADIQQEQQRIFCNLETIQNYLNESKRSLDIAVSKEIEVKIVSDSFQGIISALQKEDIGQSQKLPIPERMKGDVMLKVWGTKLEEYRGVTEKVIKDCQKIFDFIEKDSIITEPNGLPESLGEVNINHQQLKIREEFEEKKTEISSVETVSMAEIERWIVDPSSRLERIKFTEKVITNQLPELQRSFFSLEANEMPEVPKALVKFLEKHIQATKTSKESLSIQK
jgi:hypothetical protein